LTNSTLLTVQGGAVRDVARNGNAVAQYVIAKAISMDRTSPSIVRVDVNMSSEIATVYFDEPVLVASVMPGSMRLQAYTHAPLSVAGQMMVDGRVLTQSASAMFVDIQLSTWMIDRLKSAHVIASDQGSTFVSVLRNFTTDMFGNNVVGINTTNALQVAGFFADIVAPRLVQFSIGSEFVSGGNYSIFLSFAFSEPVNTSTFAVGGVRLQSDGLNPAIHYQLTGHAGMQVDALAKNITIMMTSVDLQTLREIDVLCKGRSTSFVHLSSAMVHDMSGNAIDEVDSLMAIAYSADVIQPEVIRTELSMNNGTLVIVFSEVVNWDTFFVNHITLQAVPTGSQLHAFRLNGGRVVSLTPSAVVIRLLDSDLHAMKADGIVASSPSTSYVTVDYKVVQDPLQNAAKARLPMLVDRYDSDVTLPRFVFSELDMSSGILRLQFTEPVNAATVNMPCLSVQLLNGTQPQVSVSPLFAAARVSTINVTVIEIELHEIDANRIRSVPGLARSSLDTYLQATCVFVRDMFNNSIMQYDPVPSVVSPDAVHPEVLEFAFDSTAGIATISFNRPINVSLVGITQIVLSSSQSSGASTLQLRAGTAAIVNLTSISVTLVHADLNVLAARRICNAQEGVQSCYLSFTDFAFVSSTGINVIGVNVSSAVEAARYVRDTIAPALLATGFALFDLNSGLLELRFTETINTSSVDVRQVTLQSSFDSSDASEQIQLTCSVVVEAAVPTDILRLRLCGADLNTVRASSLVCKVRSGCYVSLTTATLSDMAGNALAVPFSAFPGFRVANLTRDVTRPELSSFTLNMDEGLLSLLFNKVVRASSLVVSEITILSSQVVVGGLAVVAQKLSAGSVLTRTDDLLMVIALSSKDVNALKSANVAKSQETTYLSFTNATIQDTAFLPNAVVEIAPAHAQNASGYTADTTQPNLVNFEVVLASPIEVYLTFDEPVNPASLNLSAGLVLQSDASGTGAMVRVSGGALSPAAVNMVGAFNTGRNVLKVLLNEEDTTLVRTLALARAVNDTWLSVDGSVVSDMAGNALTAIAASQGLRANSLLSTAVYTTLVDAKLDLQKAELVLSFSNVINPATLKVSGIGLQSQMRAQRGQVYYLSSSTTNSTFGFRAVVNISAADLLGLSKTLNTGRSRTNSYVTLAANTFADVLGNDILAVTDGKAVQVSVYVARTVAPALVSFAVDMSQGLVTASFSEAVDTATVDVTRFVLLDGWSNSNVTLRNSSTFSSSTDQTVFYVQLSVSDLNAVKRTDSIGRAANTTFLTLLSGVGASIFGTPVLAVSTFSTTSVVRDSIPPVLQSYSLDVSDGRLLLTFDEVVRVSTVWASGISLSVGVNNNLQLNGGLAVGSNDITVAVILLSSDLNAMKSRQWFDSNLVLRLAAVNVTADMFDNVLGAVVPLSVTTVVRDSAAPTLVAFSMNLTSLSVDLTFSEPVRADLFSLLSVELHNNANVDNSSETFRFSERGNMSTVLPGDWPANAGTPCVFALVNASDCVATSSWFTTVRAAFTIAEFIRFSESSMLGRFTNFTYLSVPTGYVTDIYGNNATGTVGLGVTALYRDVLDPYLAEFSLDLDHNLLHLTFNELVSGQSLNATRVVLQSDAAGSFQVALRGAINQTLRESTVLTIALLFADRVRLDLSPVAKNLSTTFVSLLDAVVSDVSGNAVLAQPVGIIAAAFVVDTQLPRVLSAQVDLTLNLLRLQFSKIVAPATFASHGLVLQNSQVMVGSTQAVRLTSNSTVTDSLLTLVVTVRLGAQDLNSIKRFGHLLRSNSTSFISVANETITDIFGNAVSEVAPTQALAAGLLVDDTVHPIVMGFDVNMTALTLTVYFSETVNVSSFKPTSLRLLTSRNTTMYSYILTGGSVPSVQVDEVITVTLNEWDANQVKRNPYLFKSLADCYMSFTSDLVADTWGNAVVPLTPAEALQASFYAADVAPPNLVSFSADVNAAVLILTFDESVSKNSLVFARVTLARSSDINATAVPLTGGTLTVRNVYPAFDAAYAEVFVNISLADLTSLKERSICLVQQNCYISLAQGAVVDNVNNPSVALRMVDGLQAQSFVADTTRPMFVAFSSINLNYGIVTLLFDEPIDPTSVTVSTVSLRNSFDGSAEYIALSSTLVLNGPNNTVTLQLLQPDLDRLKRITPSNNVICRTNTNCFVRFTSSFARDMSGNAVVAVTTDVFRLTDYAQQFITDGTSPILTSFNLDLATGLLEMTFSEIMSRTTLQLPQLTLLASANASSTDLFNLNGGTVTRSNDSSVLTATLSTDDLIGIYAVTALGTSVNSTFLALSSLFASDMFGNAIATRQNGVNALGVHRLTTDSGSPIIQSFSLFSLRDGYLQLSFSHSVEISTLVFGYARIQSSRTGGIGHQLTGGTVAYATADKKRVNIFFNLRDSRVFLGTPGLTVNANTTYFSAGPGLIQDKYGRASIEVSSFAALSLGTASNFVADTVPSALINASLDMSAGVLSLEFSEAINVASLSYAKVGLQARIGSTNTVYQTQGSTRTSEIPVYSFDILISQKDLNELKRYSTIATSLSNTVVNLLFGCLLDVKGFSVVSTELAATVFVADYVAPTLTWFNANMNNGTLTLSFAETVNVSTIQLSALTLVDNVSGTNFTLTGGSVVGTDLRVVDGTLSAVQLTIVLSIGDLNEVKRRYPLASNVNSTFLSFTSAFVQDMNANSVQAISTANCMQATNFTFDTTAPEVLTITLYMQYDIPRLIFVFSETVNASTFDITQLTVHSSNNHTVTGTHDYTFQNYMAISPSSTVVEVVLSVVDSNNLKEYTKINSTNTTFFTFTQSLVRDMAGNKAVPRHNSSRQQASNFTQDRVAPTLVDARFDKDVGELTLEFSETIDAESIDIAQHVTLQMQQSVGSYSSQNSVTLTGATNAQRVDLVKIVIELTAVDLNRLKLQAGFGLAVGQSSTWVSLTSQLVKDKAGNAVTGLGDGQARQVSVFFADVTAPSIVSFSLNLNSNELTLTMSEAVNVSSLQVVGFLLQSGQVLGSGVERFALTGGVVTAQQYQAWPEVTIQLLRSDVNEVLKLTSLCRPASGSASGSNSTYLSVQSGSVVDMSGLPLQAIASAYGMEVSHYIADSMKPTLESYEVKMVRDQGTGLLYMPVTLTLHFSETVKASSVVAASVVISANVGGTASYQLQTGVVSTINDATITVELNAADVLGLRATSGLPGSGANATYLSFSEALVTDMNGNAVVAVSGSAGRLPLVYDCDLVRPVVTGFDLDMTAGVLRVRFSERIEVSSVNSSLLVLQSSAQWSGASSMYRLTGGVVRAVDNSSSGFYNELRIVLLRADTDAIKGISTLAVSQSSTFLVVDGDVVSGLSHDSAGNQVVEIIINTA